MNLHNTRQWVEQFSLLLLFFFIFLLLPYLPGHRFDNSCWVRWSSYIQQEGLSRVYYSGTDYLPFYHYILYLFGKIQGSPDNISAHVNYLRMFTLCFDVLGLWYLWKWTGKKFSFYLLVFFNILNIAYSYNTLIWGQADGIMATLLFISLYYAYQQKLLLTTVFIVLAINMKLQVIVFLPVWGLLCLFALVDSRNWKTLLLMMLTAIATQMILLLPFLTGKDGLTMVWDVVVNSFGKYPRVSMHAFNFWYLVSPSDPWLLKDTDPFIAGLRYKQIGLSLFFLSSFLALWPMMKAVWLRWKGKAVHISKEQIWLTCALIAILFFFFNTEMHERYCHPAFIFLTAFAFYTGRFTPYVLFSMAYFLSLELLLRVMQLTNYQTFLFQPQTIAILFALVVLYLFVRLYTMKKAAL